MHTAFRFQPAIGIVPGDLVGRRANPGLVPSGFGLQFDFVALLFRPSDIHPCQHRRPVAAFGATGSGVDFQKSVVAIRLAVQQRFQFLATRQFDQGFQRGFGVRHNLCVAFRLAHPDQFDIIAQTGVDQTIGRDGVQHGLAFPHQVLRPRRIVPQIGRLDQRVELFQSMRHGFAVHALRQKPKRLLDRVNMVLRFCAHACGP